MRRITFAAILMVLCLGICSSLAAQDMLKAADDAVAKLDAMSRPGVYEWRYKVGLVPNGEDPALDDSSWKKATGDSFTWGEEQHACLRATFTVPDKIAGCPVAGRRLSLKCGVDDDGVIYVDGKKAQEFAWDKGSIVLTENATPGQVFHITIKGVNTQGPGRLLFAHWDYEGATKAVARTRTYLEAYWFARDAYLMSDPKQRAPYLKCLTESVAEVKLDALERGKVDEYVDTLYAAKAKLEPVGDLTKFLNIYLVGHAHIDMNWLWLWPETVDVCRNTFSTAAKLMDEFPGFMLSQSQPAVYLAMQQEAPEVFETIKKMIARGQWDCTTTTWTEGDTNMPSGEATVRSILCGTRYMKKELGVESKICWEPDTFGHAWTMPQILAKSGIKYYYYTRCARPDPNFWWEGPDGSRVLAHAYGGYSAGVGQETQLDALRISGRTGLRDHMHVYGVGDHGGGPTREMLTRVTEYQAEPRFPRLKYSKASDYFDTVVKSGKKQPVHIGEMNSVFEGCYTTHADIKRYNRELENLLPCAEKFSSVATSFGLAYPEAGFIQSWRNTCFNQFHDILDGSAIHGAYEYSKDLYEQASAQGKSARDSALSVLCSKISTDGKGIPIVVFNPLSWARTDAVDVASPFPGEKTAVKIVDEAGKEYAGSATGERLCFTAQDVPSLGYKVFWASKCVRAPKSDVGASGTTVENAFFRVTVDGARGVISGIYDKTNQREVVPTGADASLLQILMEEPHGMSAWNIGPIVERMDLAKTSKPVTVDSGPARASLTFDQQFRKSSIVQEVVLYDAMPRIDIRITADWQEKGNSKEPAPMLKLAFPIALTNAKARFEIPYGSIERPTDGQEVVAQKWVDLSTPDYGVSLLNNCKYGYDVKGSTLRATLLRAPYDPDPAPDIGMNEMTFSLYPHKGDWNAAGTVRRAYELNEPLVATVVTNHAGELPSSKSFVAVAEPNIVVTALKKAEDDNSLILRFYESSGKGCKANIALGIPVKSIVETDLMERPIGKARAVRGAKFSVPVGKWEIKTYKLILAGK